MTLASASPPTREIGQDAPRGSLMALVRDLFTAELLRPSQRLHMHFAWVSNVEMFDNRARQFAAIAPEWPSGTIRLDRVLDSLLERGGRVRLLMRDHPHNRRIMVDFAELAERHGPAIEYAIVADQHDKCMVGDDYRLMGSMNLTHNGLTLNDERVILTLGREDAARTRRSLEEMWERLKR